jgi:hypothetical protein
MLELLGLPFFSVVVVAMVGAMALGRSKRLRYLFEVYDMVVYESVVIVSVG